MSTHCYHCGGECPPQPLQRDDHDFCCDGCQTVYTLLRDNNLTQYYALEQTPGQTANKVIDTEKYAFLDLPAIQEQLIEFREGNLSKITLLIPPIHCSSCIWLLENLPLLHSGVQSTQVNFLKKEATILFFEDKLPLKQLVELLMRLGYEPHISLASGKDKNSPRINRGLYYKIGVAGFAFGNIMLLSFPEYVSADAAAIAPEYKQLFGYLSFVLALPVLLYCSSGYFRSAWQGLQYSIMNIDIPISLGIFALFGQSSYEIFSGHGPGYMDSLAGLLFFLLIGKWYQEKIYTALSFERDYQSYFPIAISRIRPTDNSAESVPVQDLCVGDHIRIRNKEVIPADAILLSDSARIDYSFVSGESLPVDKTKGSKIYAGGRQLGRSIELEVCKEVSQSHLTQLWNQAAYHKESTLYRNFSALVEKTSKRFTIIVLTIALLAGAFWLWRQPDQAGLVVTSILIITCPCALALSMPVATGSAIRWLGRNSLYVKNAITVERMSEIDTIVFDKTGTLTHSHLSNIEWNGAPLSSKESSEIKSLVQHSTHPLSVSIAQFLPNTTDEDEVLGFNEEDGKGIEGQTGGHYYRIGSRTWTDAPTITNADPTHQVTEVHLSIDGIYRGCFRLHKTYRQGLDGLFQNLSQHYNLYLLSGDNESERQQLLPLFGQADKMRFRQSPMDKLAFVESLQQQGKKVLMVGDGLNDAGALKASHVGIAIVEDIHSFSPASDAILGAAQLPRLGAFLQFTKETIHTVKWSFLGSLAYNVLGLSFAVRAALTPLVAAVLMPLSSATVVVFVTAMIYRFNRKTLKTKHILTPPDAEQTKRPPRKVLEQTSVE